MKKFRGHISEGSCKLSVAARTGFTPRQAYFAQTSKIPWKEAIGKVSAQTIAPYPPGIPILYSGERITKEIWNFLEYFRQENRHIHGTEDGKLDYILVIQEAYTYEQ